MKLQTPLRSLGFLLLALSLAQSKAGELLWPGHGTILVDVPAGWTLRVQPMSDRGFNFEGAPDSKAPASILITLLTSDAAHPVSQDFVREQLGVMSRPFLSGSVEKRLTLQPLKTRQGYGWFAQFTDASLVGKPPMLKNFKVMRNAILGLDEHALVVAQMQLDDPQSPEAAAMLRLLSGISFHRGKAPQSIPPAVPATPPSSPDTIRITRFHGEYEATLPLSRVVMRIPESGLTQSDFRNGGGTGNPAYFQFEGSAPTRMISGWFEPAERFYGLPAMWEKDRQAMVKGGLPAPKNTTYLKQGNWDVVAYDVDLGRAASSNLRAELVQSGTWIDLHLSLTSESPDPAGREKLLALLATIQVDDKIKVNHQ